MDFLCVHKLSPLWFEIIFDQNGGDGGERLDSLIAVGKITSVLMKETRLICPQPIEAVWKWADLLRPEDVTVILLGKCPYNAVYRQHDNPCRPSEVVITMADGLAFNMNKHYCDVERYRLPRSLTNIMRMVNKTFDTRPKDDDTIFRLDNLTSWAEDWDDDNDDDDNKSEVKQTDSSVTFRGDALISWTKDGVLPLNVALTTVEGVDDAHADIGWERLTDRIVSWFGRGKEMDERRDWIWKPRVFILLGEKAKKKCTLIDQESHVVLTACDPSDPSFVGGGERDIFKAANLYLRALGYKPVRWSCRKSVEGRKVDENTK
jgi:uracil DNA glycosylase